MMFRASSFLSCAMRRFAVFFVLSIGSLLAASAPASAQTYENSARGLKEQIKNLLATRREGGPEAIKEALHSFQLQNSEAWFLSTFEDPVGEWFAKWYGEKADYLLAGLEAAFDNAAALQVTDVQIWRFVKACDEKAGPDWYPVLLVRRDKEPFYVVHFSRDASTLASIGFFAYADGRFRYLGALPLEVGSDNAFSAALSFAKLPTDPETGERDIEGFECPRPLRMDPPLYPYQALKARLQGTVHFWSVIDENGKVGNLHFVRGHCWLAEPARKAVKQWKYVPGKKNGIPMHVQLAIKVEFLR